ncbi:DUF1499 domain-containing protein [Pararhodobacter sp.]|uniref:DUF1499 domain-containing protein n=1 Tax=Pararhodobacter sp. TaxID=2127056 RepID=UPI002FE03AC2
MSRAMTLLALLVVCLIALGLGFAAYVRLAPSDPERWHVDPLTAPDPTSPNFARIDRLVALPSAEAAALIAGRARAEGAVVLAEDGAGTTWIARTALMRYPDYVSIRLIPEGEGTRIVAFSRSRFGYGDRGVNRARLARWLPE